MQLIDIDHQALSTVTAHWLECKECFIVDANMERMRKGFICPDCGRSTNGGKLYFHNNIRILIDLIQESHLSANTSVKAEKLYKGEGAHDISVIIFFCTLRESLLENLIIRLMTALNLPDLVMDRLINDNKFHIQKQDKLFRSLTRDKWSEAIAKINASADLDYKELDKFVAHCVKVRNGFIHSGSKWSINSELREACVNNIWGLINIYVALHNLYVLPLLKKS